MRAKLSNEICETVQTTKCFLVPVLKCVEKSTICAFATIRVQEFRMEINLCLFKSRECTHNAKMLKRTEITVVLDHSLCELQEEQRANPMLLSKEDTYLTTVRHVPDIC
jgi:hypothetical protein